jgi:hypothetical protein
MTKVPRSSTPRSQCSNARDRLKVRNQAHQPGPMPTVSSKWSEVWSEVWSAV